MIRTENVQSTEETAAATRSKMYRLLAEALKYPSGEFIALLKDGTFLDGIRDVAEHLPYSLPLPADSLSGQPLKDVSPDDFEAEFIRVFDVGPGGPPCPLREGLYDGGRMSIMEELVRFYNHFGLSTTKGEERELPDNLSTELEFLHYLTFKEVVALQHDHDPAPYLRAERDFLKRHPAKWLPKLTKKLDAFIDKDYKKVNKTVLLFYKELIGLAERFAQRDLEHVTALCEAAR